MARERDLPGWLAAVHPRYRVPHHAEIAVAVAVCGLLLVVDLLSAIGFSSFGVLVYYSIANIAALTQRGGSADTPAVCRSSVSSAVSPWSPPCPAPLSSWA